MIERICIIALAGILFYAKTLLYKYSSDDIPAFQRPKDPRKWMQWFWILEGRARHSPEWDHLLTMLIHIGVSVGLYVGFGSSDVSFLAAILFLINPANNQAAVWISGRSYALPALAMVWTLAIPILGPFLITCAAYYNAGFANPIVLLGSKAYWVIAFLPFIWWIHYKRFSTNVLHKASMEMFAEDKQIKIEKLFLYTKTAGFYLCLAIIPFKNTFYHSFLQSASGSGKDKAYTMKDKFFWIGVVAIVGIWLWLFLTPWSLISLALVWWFVGISQFCNLFRIHQEIAERYMYLPNVGLMFVLASVLIHWPIAIAFWIGMFATKMWFYMDSYRDDYFLIESACLNSPQSWFSWHVRALKRWETKSHQEALILWTMAQMISPNEMKLLINIATVLKLSGHHKEADDFLAKAEANIPAGQEVMAKEIIDNWKKGNLTVLL